MTRRIAIAGAMVALLIAAMFIIYVGAFSSTDEEYLFDAIESFVRRGDFRLNLTYSVRPYSYSSLDSEAMQVIISAPIFRLAETIPGIGLAHAVFTFNIIVTAISAAILFAHVLARGYGEKIALATGLLFALTTIALPYSQTFFREPLAALFLLSGIHALERWQIAFERNRGGWAWLLGGWVFYICAALTKEGMLLALPIILTAVVPSSSLRRLTERRIRGKIIAAVIISVGLALLGWWVLSHYALIFQSGHGRFNFAAELANIQADLGTFTNALAGYLISPGKSIFVYSPILILGPIGAVIAIRHGKQREGAIPLVALATFPAAYALLRSETWYGGTCWGPRYMVPITPILMLGVPAALDAALHSRRKWITPALIALITLSFMAQVPGFAVQLKLIDEEINLTGPVWTVGVWDPAHSPILTGYKLLGQAAGREWAWNLTGQALPPILCVIGVAAWGAVLAIWTKHKPSAYQATLTVIGAVISSAALIGIGLGLYHDTDIRYRADDPRLRELLAYIEANIRPEDLLLLNNPNYKYFFYNYYKLDAPMLIALPYSPGEAYSPQQPAERISSNPDDLILRTIPPLLLRLRDEHPIFWLVVDSGPYIDYAVRPVERWMVRHFFPLDEYAADPMARVVRFAALDAPAPEEPRWPYNMTQCRFGDVLTLVGYDLAGEPPYRAGEPIGISLLWHADRAPEADYTVAVYLADPDTGPISQRDSFPAGGFEPTGNWVTGEYHRDNHGLQIPENTAPGEYELWVVVYTWWDGARLPVECADGRRGEYARLGTVPIAE